MKTTKFTLAASALILTMSAAGAANAATCASAINSLQANVDVSALNADDRADYLHGQEGGGSVEYSGSLRGERGLHRSGHGERERRPGATCV